MKTEKDGRPLIVGAIPPNLKILPYHEKANGKAGFFARGIIPAGRRTLVSITTNWRDPH